MRGKKKISKPLVCGKGTIVMVNGKPMEFSTEKEAWEFIEENKKEVMS